MRYYISDNHFFHKGVIERMENRPFNSLEEMHDYMIKQWNSRVKRGDEVVILGDFSFGNTEQTLDILRQLKGKKYLIVGNHDKWLKKYDNEKHHYFRLIAPYHEMNDNKRKVILSHYPIFCYNGQFRNKDGKFTTWMLHGHIHNSPDVGLVEKYKEITKDYKRVVYKNTDLMSNPIQMINCFCVYSDYIPLTLDEWIEKEKNGELKTMATDWTKTGEKEGFISGFYK